MTDRRTSLSRASQPHAIDLSSGSKKNRNTLDYNDGPPPKKFQRVYRACNRCRNKKEKCDGAQPSCSACSSASQPCIYESGIRKRGLPQGYVRVLEMLLGSVLSTLENSEDAVNILLNKLCRESEADWRLFVLERWKSSSLVKDIERLLPTLEVPDDRDIINKNLKRSESVSADRNRTDEILPTIWRLPGTNRSELVPVMSHNSANHLMIKPSTVVDIDQLQQQFPTSEIALDITHQDSPENVIQSPNISLQASQNISTLAIDNIFPLKLTLPKRAWRLFDTFFAYTNSWLCLINRVDILRVAYTYSQPVELSRNTIGTGTHAALWAALACASQHGPAGMNDLEQSQSYAEAELTADQLYDVARKLIPEEDAQYDIGHVQALLLLGLCKIGAGQWSTAWVLLGHAGRIALLLDLSSSTPIREENASISQERQKHVFLGCFVLDTLIAIQMNKLPHLRTEIIRRVGLVPENDLEEWDPWLAPSEQTGITGSDRAQRRPTHAGSTFNQLVKITCIMNDIICSSPHTLFTQDQYQMFFQESKNWQMELPSHCQNSTSFRNVTSISACPLPHILGLHLLHLTTHALLQLRLPQGMKLAMRCVSENELTTTTVHIFRCFEMFGTLSIPPIYPIAAKVILRHAEWSSNLDEDRARFELSETLSKFYEFWSGSAADNDIHNGTDLQDSRRIASNGRGQAMAENSQTFMNIPPQPPDIMQSSTRYGLMDYSNHMASDSSRLNANLDVPPQWNQSYETPTPIMNMSSLLNNPFGNNVSMSPFDDLQNSGLPLLGSEDIDSMLSELATLDSNEMADRQSQFLRNFGFGPDIWQQEMPSANPG